MLKNEELKEYYHAREDGIELCKFYVEMAIQSLENFDEFDDIRCDLIDLNKEVRKERRKIKEILYE